MEAQVRVVSVSDVITSKKNPERKYRKVETIEESTGLHLLVTCPPETEYKFGQTVTVEVKSYKGDVYFAIKK